MSNLVKWVLDLTKQGLEQEKEPRRQVLAAGTVLGYRTPCSLAVFFPTDPLLAGPKAQGWGLSSLPLALRWPRGLWSAGILCPWEPQRNFTITKTSTGGKQPQLSPNLEAIKTHTHTHTREHAHTHMHTHTSWIRFPLLKDLVLESKHNPPCCVEYNGDTV